MYCDIYRELLVTDEILNDSLQLLEQYKEGTLPEGVTDDDLWEAKRHVASVLHPQTKEKINPLYVYYYH